MIFLLMAYLKLILYITFCMSCIPGLDNKAHNSVWKQSKTGLLHIFFWFLCWKTELFYVENKCCELKTSMKVAQAATTTCSMTMDFFLLDELCSKRPANCFGPKKCTNGDA